MNKRVGYLYDPDFLLHDTGPFHPESAERLRAIEKALAPLKPRLLALEPIAVAETLLTTVHTPEMVERVRQACESEAPIDADTVCVRASWQSALKAVGSGITAVDAVKKGQITRAFCAVRPPGHHATADTAMGFCLFNNVAVTARYAQSQGFEKVAIIDFDVHHGNGTQAIFYDDPSVLYLSTHQSPAYPGTGHTREKGVGKGLGYTFNFPLPPNSGNETLLSIYRDKLPKILHPFAPDLLLVSAGYDLHADDPLAQLRVTTEGVREMVKQILKTAGKTPVLFFLEGGYDTRALGACVAVTVEELLRF